CKPSYGHVSGGRMSKEDEANECLRPLMDHFESILSVLATTCDKTVLKRVLKVTVIPTSIVYLRDKPASLVHVWPRVKLHKFLTTYKLKVSNQKTTLILLGLAWETMVPAGGLLDWMGKMNCKKIWENWLWLPKTEVGATLASNHVQLGKIGRTTGNGGPKAETFANEDPVGFLTIQVEIFKHPGTGEYKVNVK
ncbi:hypothetical protein X801_08047, partial [Opisthorchis viverrini]